MAASRGPRPQARLLLTYGGRRHGPGRGARARVAAAPWFSPARERRRLFSSSSSGGLSPGSPGGGPSSGSSSPAEPSGPDSDPDFEPGPARDSPGVTGQRRGLRARARAWEEEEEGEENRPHHCHVTKRSWRQRARGQRPGPPLCSTPGPMSPRPRSVLAGLSPVHNASPPSPPPSPATSASLFSPEPPEEAAGAPLRSTARRACIGGSSARLGQPSAGVSRGWRASLSFYRQKRVVAEPPQPPTEPLQPPATPPDISRGASPLAPVAGLTPLDIPRGSSPVDTRTPLGGASSLASQISMGCTSPLAVLTPTGHASPLASPTPTDCASPLASQTPTGAPRRASSLSTLTPAEPLSASQKVLRECGQDSPLAFGSYLAPGCALEKIGEGVFGEVFRTERQGRAAALKVIPVEGTAPVNGSPQKTFAEVLPEILVSKELSLLAQGAPNRTTGFIGLLAVGCVRGAYPAVLLHAWDAFHAAHGSDNQRPDCFGPEQLFVVLEFELGGTDLERMRRQLSSVAAAKSLLHQVTAALAVAEEALRFEHRDLHWGNVLLRRTGAKELGYTLRGRPGAIATHGIHVSIIDYTLSRLEKDGLVVFCDLSQERELFQGRGDYQFDVYRLMRTRAHNRWAPYQPYSNVLWLHYLADKVLKQLVFKKKASTAPMRRVHQQIRAFHASALGFASATELLQGHSLFQ